MARLHAKEEKFRFLLILKAILLLAEKGRPITVRAIKAQGGDFTSTRIENVCEQLVGFGYMIKHTKTIYTLPDSGLKSCHALLKLEMAKYKGQRYLKPGVRPILYNVKTSYATTVAGMIDMSACGQQLYVQGVAAELKVNAEAVKLLIENLEALGYLHYVGEDGRKKLYAFTSEGKRACYALVCEATDVIE